MEKLRFDFTGRPAEIIEILKWYKDNELDAIIKRAEYAKGNNTSIIERVIPRDSPQNKIPVSYARRMINLLTSYMYKPGLISYASDNDAYLNDLLEVFDDNNEPLQTEQMGRQVSIQGIGFEYIYFKNKQLEPKLVKMPVAHTIPIYNFDIEPELTHFIYFYERDDQEFIEVWDDSAHTKYVRKPQSKSLQHIETTGHGFDRVPLIVYENNEDRIGDFSCVVSLIDAYDVLMSDSMNEFDRFAYAYLVMKGLALSKEDAEKIKYRRVFENLGKDDAVNFLTKDINSDFIRFMSEWVRSEIHRQSGIPNLDDYKFGTNASGETLGKFIYLMELFTDPKESYFQQALKKRIEMITVNKGWNYDPAEIKIIMSRNMPDKSMEQAELLEKYSGHVSEETLLENFADFVDNPAEELEKMREEQSAYGEPTDFFGGEGDQETLPGESEED